jgi:hypothetical protein
LCVETYEAEERGGAVVMFSGVIGAEAYYTVSPNLIRAVGAGPAHDVADLYAIANDAGVAGGAFELGGVAGSPSDLFIHTTSALVHRDGDGTLTVLATDLPPQNPESVGFAATADRLAYTNRDELVVLDRTGKVVRRFTSPNAHDLAASGDAFYWLEQPWNRLAGGGDAAAGTKLWKTTALDLALVRSDTAHLVGLVSASDGLYYAKIGPGGGIYRLPPGADLSSEPVLVASDDGLGELTVVAVDETAVYWLRPRESGAFDLLKRSKCGGASVTIARVPYGYSDWSSLVALGKRVYFCEGPSVRSVAR